MPSPASSPESLKNAVNGLLQRLTGYRLTHEAPAQREEALAAARRTARRRTSAEHGQRSAAREERRLLIASKREVEHEAARAVREVERLALRARGGDLPGHFDDDERRIIAQARPRAGNVVAELEALVEAARYVARHRIAGDILEYGVARGGRMQAVALTLLSVGEPGRHLHLAGAFEAVGGSGAGSRDDVAQAIAETRYPAELVELHDVSSGESVPEGLPAEIAILRLGTGSYDATRLGLDELYPRLSAGGILVVGDYADDGVRRAVEEWAGRVDVPTYLAPAGSARVLVKPHAARA